jgi:hypothetical protein
MACLLPVASKTAVAIRLRKFFDLFDRRLLRVDDEVSAKLFL